MEKITNYERERSSGWLRRFRVLLGALLALVVLAVGHVSRQLYENNSLDLLTLFLEDAEIVGEFWLDTMSVFFEELPRDTMVFVGCMLLGLVLLFWQTRKKRKIIDRRLRVLAKKNKMEHHK